MQILDLHPLFFLVIVFRLVRDVVANHKTTRYAGAATISRDATLDTFDFVNPFAAEIGWMK